MDRTFRLKICAGLALALSVYTSQAMGAGPVVFDPASNSTETIRDLFWLVLAVAGVIFTLVGGTLLVLIIRFRERTGTRDAEPPQIYGSNPIEVAWTVAPLLTVLVLGMVTIRSIIQIRAAEPSQHAVEVRVVGHQWWWEYEYPEFGFTTANEILIPASSPGIARPVELQLESADVIHSYWVPRLAGKTDLIPGRTNTMWFQTLHDGTYIGQCAEYCGTQHAKMFLRVDVVSPEDFAAWVEAQKKPAVNDPAVSAGRNLFLEMACANCHTIRGTSADGTFGPDLTHLMSRKTIAAGVLENTRDNIAAWLTDPDVAKKGSRMPNMRLTPEEVEQITDYLLTLE